MPSATLFAETATAEKTSACAKLILHAAHGESFTVHQSSTPFLENLWTVAGSPRGEGVMVFSKGNTKNDFMWKSAISTDREYILLKEIDGRKDLKGVGAAMLGELDRLYPDLPITGGLVDINRDRLIKNLAGLLDPFQTTDAARRVPILAVGRPFELTARAIQIGGNREINFDIVLLPREEGYSFEFKNRDAFIAQMKSLNFTPASLAADDF